MRLMLPAEGGKVQTLLRLTPALVAAMLLGCVDTGIVRPTATENPAAEALRLADQGNHLEAGQAYLQLARRSEGDQAVSLYLDAATQFLLANRPDLARESLQRAGNADNPDLQARLLITGARIDLQQGAPERSLQQLNSLPGELSAALLPESLELRGRSLFALGQPVAAIGALIERETWLSQAEDVRDNQRLIWNGMQRSNAEIIEPYEGDVVLAGWLELLPLAQRSASNPFGVKEELVAWRGRNVGHPAAQYLIDELVDSLRRLTDYPGQVAILLPLSGRQKAAAEAIRNGIVAAHLSAGAEPRPTLRVYDTTQLGAQQTYFLALQNGADFVLGPLLKRDVEAVAAVASGVPTLALNYLEDNLLAAPGFYQFALAPEDEANEVAQRVMRLGQTHGVVLVANNDWGIRVLTSFQQTLESLGGTLLEFRAYDPRSQDFTGPITSLLKISESNQRYRRLAANLNQEVEFEPRRRQDADFIFLAAESREGRLLMPQLRFHYAADIPTYATSDVYRPGSRARQSDLNGIVFPDAPWLLNPDEATLEIQNTLGRYWPRRTVRLGRLYAMGFDAYRLVPLLNQADQPSLAIPGLSGFLTLDLTGRIHRQLQWAQIRRGKPETLMAEEVAPEQEDTTEPQ